MLKSRTEIRFKCIAEWEFQKSVVSGSCLFRVLFVSLLISVVVRLLVGVTVGKVRVR